MPELPEVEIAARNLRRWAGGKTIRAVHADGRAARLFRPATAKAVESLSGARVEEIRRIGKNLLLTLVPRGRASARIGVWSHLGMTGKWLRRTAKDPAPPATRVELDLAGGARLCYVDRRMFGRFRIVPGARFDALPEIAALGPDPLVDGIDVPGFAARLARLKAPIKVALLDQTLLAGVGNIQASESLFRAGIDPRRPARSLSAAEVKRLAAAIRASIAFTLKTFDAAGADGGGADIGYVEERTAPNPFLVYGRAGARCPGRSKAGVIVRIVQAGRATFYCPHCQT
ncbi:MAG TPA: DNA-formamidopyrimidine glycosylase family protein [Polyangia bacterium]|jgi:formamidopyrimidine-DNA glycosylase|nr:DNA-formamidopyrimidine glycosylase family protein [Polyangia bacterium]